MTAILFLARHGSHAEVGRVLSGHSEIGLDERGRAEARRLADRLADEPLLAVRSSPRRRALDTAAPVAAAHRLEVETDDDLDEIDFGRWGGTGFDELDADPDWTRWNAERATAATPAGVTMAQVATRAQASLDRAGAQGGAVLLVSHCDVIRAVVARRLGLDFGRVHDFAVDPGSLTSFAQRDGRLQLTTLNERPR